MHIEPGLVDATKITLSYVTGAAALGLAAKATLDSVSETARTGLDLAPAAAWVGLRALAATLATFFFFQVLPHQPVGVSEVHFILGSTLFLVFGAGPAMLGLAGGLLLQGALIEPIDLPQYGMNVTTLLVPLAAIGALAKRIIPAGTAYADVSYGQMLALSGAFQGGVVGWVAFWVVWGQGFGAETLAALGAFAAAYIVVIAVEPVADLGALAMAKRLRAGRFVSPRVTRVA